MKRRLTDTCLSQLSTFIAAEMGLYFPRARWDDLERKIQYAAKEFDYIDIEMFIQWIVSSPLSRETIETLASHLTISETYFWREPQVFEALCDQILPVLIRAREKSEKRLRIWSAGCASGEEPYSIAIALHKLIPDIKNWHITILATDINPQSLHKAEAGVYGEWSFRNAPPWLKTKYFDSCGNAKYMIRPEIHQAVSFQYLNLTEDVYPTLINNTNAMDIIFCRNVLLYFAPELAHLVAQRFYNCLIEGGWLIVSECELSTQLFNQFSCVQFSGAHVYRRELRSAQSKDDPNVPSQVTLPSAQRVLKKAEVARVSPRPIRNQENVRAAKQAVPETLPMDDVMCVRSLANQGKLNEALSVCERAIAADKLDIAHYFLLANILLEQKRDAEAIAALKQVIYLDPNYVPAHFLMGNLEQQHGKAAAANKHFKNALALLNNYKTEDVLLETESLTAGRLREIIHAILKKGA